MLVFGFGSPLSFVLAISKWKASLDFGQVEVEVSLSASVGTGLHTKFSVLTPRFLRSPTHGDVKSTSKLSAPNWPWQLTKYPFGISSWSSRKMSATTNFSFMIVRCYQPRGSELQIVFRHHGPNDPWPCKMRGQFWKRWVIDNRRYVRRSCCFFFRRNINTVGESVEDGGSKNGKIFNIMKVAASSKKKQTGLMNKIWCKNWKPRKKPGSHAEGSR